MDELTTRQIIDLNSINQDTGRMDFAAMIQTLIQGYNSVSAFGTPVNAVAAAINLAVSGVVVDGETVAIDNPEVVLSDMYEFLADIAQSKTDPANLAVNIVPYTTRSYNILTIDTQPTSGDTMTIGTKVYTFVPDGTANADGEISVATDKSTAQDAIIAAVNGTDGVNTPNVACTIAAFVGDGHTVTAIVGGVLGDSIVTTETFTAVGNVFDSATLAGGADCSAANAITALAAATVALDTQGVVGDDSSGDTLDLTADIAGVIGNAIVIAETMINGAFAGAAVLLTGGVDGTVGVVRDTLIDDSYLYLCVAANTVADQNWRRISVGSVY